MSLRNKLVSFSASVMHFLKDMPVSIKVTAYYTLFLGLLLLLVTMSGFQMAKYLENQGNGQSAPRGDGPGLAQRKSF